MRAMVLEKPRQRLMPLDVAKPKPDAGQLLVRLSACAVCRTDLHIVDGELPDPKLPLIPGHQIVGHIEQVGKIFNRRSRRDSVARLDRRQMRLLSI
jgi:propanol-preferring alcohol dehydrogenase